AHLSLLACLYAIRDGVHHRMITQSTNRGRQQCDKVSNALVDIGFPISTSARRIGQLLGPPTGPTRPAYWRSGDGIAKNGGCTLARPRPTGPRAGHLAPPRAIGAPCQEV